MINARTMKLSSILVLAVFSIALFKGSAQTQSYWEKRQKSQEQLRKKQLGTTEDQKKETAIEEQIAPKEAPKASAEEKPKASEEAAPNDADFDLGLEPSDEDTTMDDEDYGDMEDIGLSTAPYNMPLDLGMDLDLGNKEIKKIADKSTFIDPNKIKIPEEYGEVREIYVSKKNPNSPLIIHVQDAHVNYDAQVSIAHIIEEILVNQGINHICIEGASVDDARLTTFRIASPKGFRVKKANENLKNGDFDGIQYLYGVTDYPLQISGIEDKKVYWENFNLYFDIEELRPKSREYLDALKVNINNLKVSMFSKELNELETNKDSYSAEKMTLNAYVKYLNEKTVNLKININLKYPNVSSLVETVNMEEKIDFPSVDSERDKFITGLKSKLSADSYKNIQNKQTDFYTGKIKAVDFYSYLTSLDKGSVTEKYPNLALYTNYLAKFDTVDTYKLFKEIDGLEKDIKSALYKNEDERTLDKLAADFVILREFVELGLTPDEYTYYQNNKKDMNVNKWADIVKSMQKKYKLNKPIPRNSGEVERIIPALENFYKTAILRDKILVEKTLANMKNSNLNNSIMICGGFHTPRITGIMRTMDVSYIVIAPKINNPTEPGLYDKVLRKYRNKK